MGHRERVQVYGGTPKAAPRTVGASGGTVLCRRPLGRPLSDHQRGRDASGLACYPRACPPRTRAGATSRGSESAGSCGFLRTFRLVRVSRYLSRSLAEPSPFPSQKAVVTNPTRGAFFAGCRAGALRVACSCLRRRLSAGPAPRHLLPFLTTAEPHGDVAEGLLQLSAGDTRPMMPVRSCASVPTVPRQYSHE